MTQPILDRRRFLGSATLVAGAVVMPASESDARPEPGARLDAAIAEINVVLRVNSAERRLTLPAYAVLVDVLRDRLGLPGTKKGCGQGTCGACTVLIDGRPALACLTFAALAEGRDVVTIEGLSGTNGGPHPVQAAFVRHDALQCGYCTPGQVISALALLEEGRPLDRDMVRERMSGNLCRCGAYPNIVAAVLDAAAEAAQ